MKNKAEPTVGRRHPRLRNKLGRHVAGALAVMVACTTAVGSTTAFAEPVTSGLLPVPFDTGAAILPFFFPEDVPAGANDPNCRLTPEHPRPVILVNGTFVNQAANWQAGAPFLRNNGYCVFTFNYGNPTWISEIPVQSVADVRDSARQLAAEVDKVRAQTGTEKVDLVGASLGGGLVAHRYINFLGGDRYVDKLIGLSPSNHGTTLSGIVFLRKSFPPLGPFVVNGLEMLLPASIQQTVGHELVKQTYANGDTRPGVTYTTIVTKYDEVVTPFTNQFLDGPNVTNILMQDGCEENQTDHLGIHYSERAWGFVRNALDPEHPAPVLCVAEGFMFPGLT